MPTKQKDFDPGTIVTGGETAGGNGNGNNGNHGANSNAGGNSEANASDQGQTNGNAGAGTTSGNGGSTTGGATGNGNGGTSNAGGNGNAPSDIAADITTTATLAIGEVLSSDIGGETDSDWVRVELTAGTTYTFGTSAPAGAADGISDTVLVLYDAEGNLVSGNDDSSGTLFSSLLHTPDADGTYYLAVQGYAGAMGSYDLTMETVDLATDTISASVDTTAVIAAGDVIDGTLEFTGDHDWYRVEVGAGQAIAIWTSAGANGSVSDTTITVYDQDGNVVMTNDDFGDDLFSRVEFAAPTSGTYYVDIGGFNDSEAGSYTLNAELTYDPQAGSVDELGNYIASTWHSDMGTTAATWALDAGNSISVDLSGLDAGLAEMVRDALQAWSDASGITFTETVGGALSFVTGAQTSCSCDILDSTINGAVVTLGTDITGTGVGRAYQLIMQQVGHALGLGNAGRYAHGETPEFSADNVVFLNDSNSISVMSGFDNASNAYTAGLGFSQFDAVTPLLADIAAVQALYGLSTAARSGNDTYGFNATAGDLYDATLMSGTGYTIVDGDGVDTLDYSGHAADQFITLAENTFMNIGGLTGNVSIAAGSVIENARGGTGRDTIHGNDVANTILGMDGDDTIEGFSGNDNVQGGAGNDVVRGGNGWDVLEGGDGDDVIDGGNGTDFVSYRNASAGVTVDLGRLDAQDTIGAGIDTLSALEHMRGSAFADTLTGDDLVNNIYGGAGDDIIDGGGAGGSDRLFGEDGNDIMIGGPGWDQLRGGAGDDILDGGNGGDLFKAGAGNDTIYGGRGTDRAYLFTGDDIAWGGTENDMLSGQGGNDTLYGEDGNDNLYGGNGNDFLDGGANIDFIHGGAGADTILGGDGDDVLLGSWGRDTLSGGLGADEFVFEQGHSGRWMGNADVITDFNAAEGDIIDLSGIDAIAGGADDAFTFIGSEKFSGTAGELAVFQCQGNTYLAGDVNGDGVADFHIQLQGQVDLTMADLVL
ncbi:M10 family metallopeptidase C-terminal domain-containing protein [Qipengyuania sp. 1NDH17]|uniref:M10 family metallopeptidase C-terminal domain-containing protein n=1 Tax=Qipengyuania polymorpha TaxID=2867234 RepID=A0ABS7J463_9SPHN|nr:M10 family metallopeptidase C-terminal domain-containing protein [Qipengyuania polymorpha]MBX7458228.1 M10 family metallopeptidase C-terminal domain-containing protein [Qipengyuania polymorpha]